jgi:hypothetical protein
MGLGIIIVRNPTWLRRSFLRSGKTSNRRSFLAGCGWLYAVLAVRLNPLFRLSLVIVPVPAFYASLPINTFIIQKRQFVGVTGVGLMPSLPIIIVPGACFGPHHPIATPLILKLEGVYLGNKGVLINFASLKITMQGLIAVFKYFYIIHFVPIPLPKRKTPWYDKSSSFFPI